MASNRSDGPSSHVNNGFLTDSHDDIELHQTTDGTPRSRLPVKVQDTTEPEYDIPIDHYDSAPLEHNPGLVMRGVGLIQNFIVSAYSSHQKLISSAVYLVILVGFHVYVGLSIAFDFNNAIALMVLVLLAWFFIVYFLLFKPLAGRVLEKHLVNPTAKLLAKFFNFQVFSIPVFKIAAVLIVIAAIAVFLALDTTESDRRNRLVSLGGLLIYVVITFVFSVNPAKVQWGPVLSGLILQFVFGLLILRWQVGSTAFGWLAHQVSAFLDYVKSGTSFVYGFTVDPPPICGVSSVFAFQSLATVLFFGSVVNVLYYLGAMQFVITRLGWAMQKVMGTTAAESLNAAGSIFIGQTEAPLMIRPYLHKQTTSEIHAIMTCGFATIAGSVFNAYVGFGACPTHLLSASIMSAPAALAVSKLFYPETEKSRTKTMADLNLGKGQEKGIIEAASVGASNGISLVANIVANLIVFLAFLAFFNNILEWLGGMVGIEGLTFERLLSWVFFPLAYMMGVGEDTDEVLRVSQLMGVKTFLNEFIAYQQMGDMIKQGLLSDRAQLLATYALCGFSNLSSIGIQLGGLSAMCPDKKSIFAAVAFRAMIAGTIACFMTACVAGMLVGHLECYDTQSTTAAKCFNITMYLT